MAPCVLYGSNVERLGSAPGTFANHCLPYTGLYLLGNTFFGWNCLAPWFSYPIRTAIRRKFNLEVNFVIIFFNLWNLQPICVDCHRRERLAFKILFCYQMRLSGYALIGQVCK